MDYIIYISEFFKWILSTSWRASVLVCLILLVKIILKNKMGSRWHYMLWLLVIVRLILPWTPESSFSVYNLNILGKLEVLISREETLNLTSISSEQPIGNNLSLTNPIAEVTPKEAKQFQTHSFSVFHFFSVIWLLGVLLFSFYTIAINRKFVSQVKKKAGEIDLCVMDIFEKCKDEMSIRKKIILIESNQVTSPTLFGFLSPHLVMPKETVKLLSSDQIRYIFMHELAHIKRNDIIQNWVMHSLIIFHWFNPILWYALYKMREDQEIACDALALTNIKSKESMEYGKTIIQLLEVYSRVRQVPGIANLSGSKSQIRRRIMRIKLFKQNSYRWSILGFVILVLLSCVALTNVNGASSPEEAVMGSGYVNNLHPTYHSLVREEQLDKRTKLLFYLTKTFVQNESEKEIIAAMIVREKWNGKWQVDTSFRINIVTKSEEVDPISLYGSEEKNYEYWYGLIIDNEVNSVTLNNDKVKIMSITPDYKVWFYFSQKSTNNNIQVANVIAHDANGSNIFERTLAAYESTNNHSPANLSNYPENENGQTYGSVNDATSVELLPDLIHMGIVNDISGYVLKKDYLGELSRTVPLYDIDGINIIGSIHIGVKNMNFPKNKNGQTYGSNADAATSVKEPELISAIGVDGTAGYVLKKDLDGEQPKSPEEAIARQNGRPPGGRDIPLYDVDGENVIGVFHVGGK